MPQSTPASRGSSPSRATAAATAADAGSSMIDNGHIEPDRVAVPSVNHFTVDPEIVHRQNEHHHINGNGSYSGNAATFNNKNSNSNNSCNNTQTASRMVEEQKQQRSRMPVYPGLERFTLLEKMGDGAFSNVYKAHDTKADRIVAVKVVRKYDMNAHQRANILKEVQIMRQLDHRGIIQLYEFAESEEHYFLVLELAQGGELFHRIVKLTYFSEDLARHVIVQVAQAIRYLHEEKGVIHRDIKPENILFEPIPIVPSQPEFKPSEEEEKEDEGIFQPGIGGGGIGRVKIADFGLSKIVWDEQTMTPCGTVGYTAPEIVKDERYSKSVDMWALGCVLYTILCGFPPFYDESIQALTEKVARGQFTFLSPWWDEISAEVKDLISHLLCVNPKERYTIDQFLAHPWIKAGEYATQEQTHETARESHATPNAFAENKVLANVAAMTPDYGTPLRTPKTPYKRRAENPLSPGIGLREVFDVSNAVHRMGEESRRRYAHQGYGLQPGDAHQRQAFMTHLNEEDEDEGNSSEGSGSVMSEDEVIAAGMGGVKIDQAVDQSALQRQQQEYQRAQERIAAEKHRKYMRQQQQAGQAIPSHHITSSVASSSNKRFHQAGAAPAFSNNQTGDSAAISAMASTSNASSAKPRRRTGFELNMNQATLLKRRAKNNSPLHLNQTIETQEQMQRQRAQPLAV
ncbi:hypothetical protein BGZ70_006307 [Mortierella alpina]|uniref:Protein kinase domain-containing protein n=1 Tax=Mortierella alpina TaxID=64518 RepID=A0A9P6M3R5_MORAP|nr:hypothetical protein BGZ70_006307 [Mortierella alpina]